MKDCPYGWAECAYCLISGDYATADAVIKTAFYECTASE